MIALKTEAELEVVAENAQLLARILGSSPPRSGRG